MKDGRSNWSETLHHLRDGRVLRIGLLGFSSGLPLLLVFGTLSFWLAEAAIDRSTIGYISWVALAYAVKVLWSPLVDQLRIPWLAQRFGRRRGWLLLSQLLVCIGLVGMASTDPSVNLSRMVIFAFMVAVSSATQDIVVDAYRIETAEVRLQGIMAGVYTSGYRLAMFVSSAGALALAAWIDVEDAGYQYASWRVVYLVMAGLMGVGILTTLLSPEPDVAAPSLRDERWWAWVRRAIIEPFSEFLARYGARALLLLALIATYRISDIVMGVIANVFYIDTGFTKDQIAIVVKTFGVAMTVAGGLVGGVLTYRVGVMRMMFIGGVLAAATNVIFAILAMVGQDDWLLVIAVGCDTFSAGIASSAFIAYLSALTNVAYSATQYALFSSLMLLLPKFVGGFSGAIVEATNYPMFFGLTALMGVPVLALVVLVMRVVPIESTSLGK